MLAARGAEMLTEEMQDIFGSGSLMRIFQGAVEGTVRDVTWQYFARASRPSKSLIGTEVLAGNQTTEIICIATMTE